MDENFGLGLYVDTARFVPADMFFKESHITQERTVTCYELVFFLRDGGIAVINGKKHLITAGSVRFHRPGDRVYSYRFHEIYVIHFFASEEEQAQKVLRSIPCFMKLPDIDNEIATIGRMIKAMVEKDDFTCVSCLWSLLYSIKTRSLTQQPPKSQKNIALIKAYIDRHFSEKITLSSLAEHFFMHPVYLQKKFKKETGISPAAYLQKVRISQVKTYLLTTDMSIEEIAERTGFCNASYCIQIFKEETALTPTAFREKALLPESFL